MIEWSRYKVTKDGRIFDLKRNNVEIKTHIIDGYKYCVLRNEGKGPRQVSFPVHRLVAMQYCPEYYEGCAVHHIDGNRTNNNIENLQCLSTKEHLQLHKIKYEDKEVVCPVCKNKFIWSASSQRSFKSRSKTGPFCSSRCALDYARTKRTIRLLHNT